MAGSWVVLTKRSATFYRREFANSNNTRDLETMRSSSLVTLWPREDEGKSPIRDLLVGLKRRQQLHGNLENIRSVVL